MGIGKIFIICLYFFLLWLTMVANKELERNRTKWAERRADLIERFWREEQEEHWELEREFDELQAKYDNVEMELKARDKQYLELLERTNKQ